MSKFSSKSSEDFKSKTGYEYSYQITESKDDIVVFRTDHENGFVFSIVDCKINWEEYPENFVLLPGDVIDRMNEFVKKMLKLKAFL